MSARVSRVRRDHPAYLRNTPQIQILLGVRDALDFGRWLESEPHGDPGLGTELAKLAHEAWEEEG